MQKNNFKDNDDLSLYCCYIKAFEYKFYRHEFVIDFARRNKNNTSKYEICRLIIKGVSNYLLDQNAMEEEIPEFYRSAIVSIDNSKKLFYFGIDWGLKYCDWNIEADSYEIQIVSVNPTEEELEWIK